MSENAVKRKMSTFSKLMLILIGACLLGSLILTVAMQIGYTFVYTGTYFYLPLAMVALLMLWGIYWLIGKCKTSAIKIGLGLLLGLAAAIVTILVFMYLSVYITYSGTKYAVLTSPNGENKAVVMQGYYFDEDRVVRRYGEDYQDKTTEKDLMTDYHAYPQVFYWFMDTREENPVHIRIGMDSENAKLLKEWVDDDTLRLYVGDPGEDDTTEDLIVRFAK